MTDDTELTPEPEPQIGGPLATRIEQGIEIRPAIVPRAGPTIWILHERHIGDCFKFLYAGWSKDDAISYAQGYQRRNRTFDYKFMIKEFKMPKVRVPGEGGTVTTYVVGKDGTWKKTS